MFGNNLEQKSSTFFCCEICDYNTSRKNNLEKHLKSKKHLAMIFNENGNVLEQKVARNCEHICKKCNKKYKDYSGLWKHNKKCKKEQHHNTQINETITNNHNKLVKDDTFTDKNIIMLLIKENNDLKKLMMEQNSVMIESNNKLVELCKNGTHNTINNTHTNSHNKAFNLNIFLNETCKNAMNIMEFAESIQLQLTDLEKIGEIGYIEGISNIIVKKLRALDITERPIHCTDKKRETIYIKDEDKWEKEDENKIKIRKVIHQVARKNERLLPKYREKHPGCQYSESKYSDKYNKIVIEAMGGDGENPIEKSDKIIKNIAKEVIINKQSIV